MDATPGHLEWIRPPQQERTHKTLAALLDAAEALLQEKGFEDVAVADIARHAGSSVGGFYRRFPDKEALLHALHERFCAEAYATADVALAPARWAGVPLPEMLREQIRFLTDVYQTRQGLDRAIYQRSLADPIFRERSNKLQRYVLSGMAALILARRSEIAHPEPEVGVYMALRVALAYLADQYTVGVLEWEPVAISDERIVEELTRICLQHLCVPSNGTETKE